MSPTPPLSLWLPIDKPPAMTSHDVVAIARKRLNMRKIGHTGTLDPDATGMLVLALGKATRLIQYLPGNKVYQARIRLGITTDTLDASGQITGEAPVPPLSRSELETHLSAFIGKISQLPPMVSAVSYQGQRLYKLARQGLDIKDRPRRDVTIHQLELQTMELPEFELVVACSAGTYIRTLAQDLGEKIGCGAHLSQLRRLSANGFERTSLIALDSLDRPTAETQGMALDHPLAHLPVLKLNEEETLRFQQGQKQTHAHIPSADIFRVYQDGQAFLGLGEALVDQRFKPRLVF